VNRSIKVIPINILCFLFIVIEWGAPHFFVFGAIIGLIAEVVAVHFGAWQYTNPSLLRVPIWLPIAWGFVVVLIKRITEIFVVYPQFH
jgi:hypothetical protein